MRPVVILFAKAPVPGRVKTRLSPPLPPEDAAELHSAFVQDTLDCVFPLRESAEIEIHTDIPTDAWLRAPVQRKIQYEGNLGLKMLKALDDALKAGRPKAMIVGSDAPNLPAGHLRALMEMPSDIAVGPTDDGGFYAIAARRVHPRMFEGVEWSTGSTYAQTLAGIRACGLTASAGPPWYDIDTGRDLARILADPSTVPPNTAKVYKERKLEQYLWEYLS